MIDPIGTARVHGWLHLVNAVGNSANQRVLLLMAMGVYFLAGGLYAWFVFLRVPLLTARFAAQISLLWRWLHPFY